MDKRRGPQIGGVLGVSRGQGHHNPRERARRCLTDAGGSPELMAVVFHFPGVRSTLEKYNRWLHPTLPFSPSSYIIAFFLLLIIVNTQKSVMLPQSAIKRGHLAPFLKRGRDCWVRGGPQHALEKVVKTWESLRRSLWGTKTKWYIYCCHY